MWGCRRTSGFIGIWALRGYVPAATLSSTIPHSHLTNYSLLVLPLFIMMGFFAYFAGITRDLYWAARQWCGHLPGGLAMDTAGVITGMGRGFCSGMDLKAFARGEDIGPLTTFIRGGASKPLIAAIEGFALAGG